jgi:hypothetical protein
MNGSDIYVGCGVKKPNENKDFASGTVLSISGSACTVEWYWIRYTGKPIQEPIACVEYLDQLVLMSVPDHDHWPPNPLAHRFLSVPPLTGNAVFDQPLPNLRLNLPPLRKCGRG